MTAGVTIEIAQDVEAIVRCYPVMRELRPHLFTEAHFVERVRRQQTEGYQLAALTVTAEVRAVAGFRCQEMLFAGRHMYVDDLVTREADRSEGYGAALLDWLVELARARKCESFELDSGVQRFDAHRFYFMKRMHISSYHFRLLLNPDDK